MQTEYRKDVRKYFLSGRILPVILIILGLIIGATGFVSREKNTLLIIIGVALLGIGIWLAITGTSRLEQTVDQYTQFEVNNLMERGIKKLNVIASQFEAVNPVVIYGQGATPDFSLGRKAPGKLFNPMLLFLWPIMIVVGIIGLFKKKKDYDPIEATKIGTDGNVRSMLIQVTVYAFTDSQLLIYKGNVDISTGCVYYEETAEVFYSDISSIQMAQDLEKYYSDKNKEFVYKTHDYLVIHTSGGDYRSSMVSALDNSLVDNQFAGMRSLIRQRKIR